MSIELHKTINNGKIDEDIDNHCRLTHHLLAYAWVIGSSTRVYFCVAFI